MTTTYYIKQKEVKNSKYNYNCIFEDYIKLAKTATEISRASIFISNEGFDMKNYIFLKNTKIFLSNKVDLKIEYKDENFSTFIENFTLHFEEDISLPFDIPLNNLFFDFKIIKMLCNNTQNEIYIAVLYKVYLYIL